MCVQNQLTVLILISLISWVGSIFIFSQESNKQIYDLVSMSVVD